jgi:imidazolonepropionase
MQDVGLISHGAVVVKDGRILAIGPTESIRERYSALQVINASGQVVCPGFVDPHTHVVYSGDRINEFEQRIRGATYLEIMAAGGGIVSTMRATRHASVEANWWRRRCLAWRKCCAWARPRPKSKPATAWTWRAS